RDPGYSRAGCCDLARRTKDDDSARCQRPNRRDGPRTNCFFGLAGRAERQSRRPEALARSVRLQPLKGLCCTFGDLAGSQTLSINSEATDAARAAATRAASRQAKSRCTDESSRAEIEREKSTMTTDGRFRDGTAPAAYRCDMASAASTVRLLISSF